MEDIHVRTTFSFHGSLLEAGLLILHYHARDPLAVQLEFATLDHSDATVWTISRDLFIAGVASNVRVGEGDFTIHRATQDVVSLTMRDAASGVEATRDAPAAACMRFAHRLTQRVPDQRVVDHSIDVAIALILQET